MTEREEDIRGRMAAIRRAAEDCSDRRIAHALRVAQEHALEDVAYLLGVINAMREREQSRVAS